MVQPARCLPALPLPGDGSLPRAHPPPPQMPRMVCQARRGCRRIVSSASGAHSVACCDAPSGQVVKTSGAPDDRQALWQVEVQWWWQG
ncbi:uncharacterized protein DS421_11g335960 [Arachis hypogaea]|nr:uncharacterized protein DS421_11g335960 [Arachis hypogaea]